MGAALVYAGLGEKDEAFRSLEKAIELRGPWPFVILLKVDPRFDSLREDPRFQNLLRRMNLPPLVCTNEQFNVQDITT